MSDAPHPSSAAIDRDNPWPGLASFTEDARGFFFGREKETDELSRLVRRQTLTVLFGQSGLGKSSLLQAGVFPLLREADFLPLYLRLDHSEPIGNRQSAIANADSDSPIGNRQSPIGNTLADQVKAALVEAFKTAGADAPAPRADESLWEYFHRKDIDIWSAKNRLLTPVLAFDQFEEVFTLGRATEAARERSRVFLAELACLVENRAPVAVQEKLDHGELDPARFNFTKPSCQVILSLREDFLPDLEGLKHEMPALVHNRLRLKKLSGMQALEIVTKPAPQLLAEGVAEKIVEFVAGARGGSTERLAELDVEPPLLSVICRELNERRRTLGQTQITADLVSGNRREILHDFYERSVRDLPEAMREFIEDHLLTKSGFRDNLALETALEHPGVTRPLLDILVSRRIVRLEDRLGVQRVELTHDVLAEVIRASRDSRQQRQAVELARERERRVRRRMWVARTIAAGLLVVAGTAIWAAYGAVQRQRAEARRWSRSDTVAAARFLDEGKAQEGIAFLVHAAQIDPANPIVAPRLISALTSRSFARPYGEIVKIPGEPQFSPNAYFRGVTDDGRYLGVSGKDGTFRLIDFESGRIAHEIRPGSDATEVAVVIRSKVLAYSVNQWFAFYNSESGLLQYRAEAPGAWSGNSGSADGRFVSLAIQNTVTVWDYSGKVWAKVPHEAPVGRNSLSDDGARLASIFSDRRSARIWSLPDGRPVTAPFRPANGSEFFGATFSHDGRFVAFRQEGGVQLRDAATGQPVGPLLPHDGLQAGSGDPLFTSDDSLLITASTDRTAKVWNPKTGTLALPPLVHGGNVMYPRLVSNDRLLFTYAGDGFFRLWDLTTGQLVVEPMKQTEGGLLSAAPDGRRLAQVTADGRFSRYWAEPNSARPLALLRGPDVLGSAWLPDQPAILRQVARQRVVNVDVATGKETAGGFDFPEPILNYLMSPNGRVMLVTTAMRARQAWTLGPDGVKVTPLPDFPTGAGLQTRLSADGGLALAIDTGAAQAMRVWNLRTGEPVAPAMAYAATIWPGNANGSFSADNRWVAAGSRNGEGKIWEVATGRLVHELKPLSTQVRRVEFSPDGTRVATVELQASGRLWDAATGQPVTPQLKHRGPIGGGLSPAGFSNDGRWLMTFSLQAGSVAVWDVRTGAQVGTQIGHTSGISLPVFSPDGSQVLTACNDGAARLWDTQTGQLIAEPMRHPSPVTSVSFSPDGRFILTKCDDKLDRIWAVPPPSAGRTPEWLTRLATLQSGTVVSDDGKTTDASSEQASWESLRAEVNALPAGAPFAAWGRWLLADREKRTLAPGFEITAAEAEARGLVAAPVTTAPVETVAPGSSLLR